MISDDKLDINDTFTCDASSNDYQEIKPTSGEVWKVSVYARCTANGSSGDDIYLRLYRTSAQYVTLDSDTGSSNPQVSTDNNSVLLSNDNYLRIDYTADSVGSTRTITYYYQGSKVS